MPYESLTLFRTSITWSGMYPWSGVMKEIGSQPFG